MKAITKVVPVQAASSSTRIYATSEVRLSMYLVPPVGEITVEELELYAIDRLKVLKEIENIRVRGLTGAAYYNRMREFADKFLPISTAQEQRKDHISHFLLRFAYCRGDDRKWFLRQETDLFRYRLKNVITVPEFIKQNKLHYENISAEEFAQYGDSLKHLVKSNKPDKRAFGHQPIDEPEITHTAFYKVPFEKACDLVARRRVIMKKGFAFLHFEDLVSIICREFKDTLGEGLEASERAFPERVAQDERISGFMHNLPRQYIDRDWSKVTQTGTLDLSNINELAQRSFPLCMRSMHESLRSKHHLFHDARMQYGLFLKGIGLTLEDALKFWKSEFTRVSRITPEKFDKEYAYNIRHNYGLEGRKADYTPYSCVKIIESQPAADKEHGCPYRHFSRERLVSTLQKHGLDGNEVEDIIGEVDGQRWGHACHKYFMARHKGYSMTELVINHPQQYYSHSCKYHKQTTPQEAAQ